MAEKARLQNLTPLSIDVDALKHLLDDPRPEFASWRYDVAEIGMRISSGIEKLVREIARD